MNDDLKMLVLEAGAPKEALNELWFNVFCMRFADILLTMAEEAITEQD